MPWLNHAGTSWPKPDAVRAAVADALAAPPETFADRFTAGRAALAELLGVKDPARVLITPGATSALQLGLHDLPWQPGDRLLIGPTEHHALHGAATRLRHRGVSVETLPLDAEEGPDLGALEAALRQGGVRLVALAWASNVTGALVDAAAVVGLAHAHGALCLLDAAQTAGVLDLDLDAVGADLVAIAGHKGPQGPQGIGALVRGPRVPAGAPGTAWTPAGPPVAGPTGFCDAGSVNLAGLAGLVAGLRSLGADRHARRHALTTQLLDGLGALPGARILGPTDPTRRVGLVSVALPDLDGAARQLAAAGVHASIGRHCAPAAHHALGTLPHGALRLSVGPGTTPADVDAALSALKVGRSSGRPA
jgi:selenocysteine lyase/cysteine desulfurase